MQTTTEVPLSLSKTSPLDAASIFTAGIACNALVVLEEVGVLQLLKEHAYFYEKELDEKNKYKNPLAILAALRALCYAELIVKRGDLYLLTKLGSDVVNKIGVFILWFQGYANVFSKQSGIATGEDRFSFDDIHGGTVAKASTMISETLVDPTVIEIIYQMKPRGTICDLGCGSGKRLIKACQATQSSGLGLDLSVGAVDFANEVILKGNQDLKIKIEQADVTQLSEVWEDVDILMQAFMTHHIVPREYCIDVFRNYLNNFPNMRYFLVLDTVTSAEENFSPKLFAPGFDYIHRLEGLEPRPRNELLYIFDEAGFNVENEVAFPIPNSFLWVLARR